MRRIRGSAATGACLNGTADSINLNILNSCLKPDAVQRKVNTTIMRGWQSGQMR